MKKITLLLTFYVIGIFNIYAKDINPANYVSKRHIYYITTDFPDRTMITLRKEATLSGGFVKYFDGKIIKMRIPSNKVNQIIKVINKSAYIQDKNIHSKNHSERFISIKTKLKIKKDLLNKLYKIFRTSSMIQTLEVEKEINNIITDIEGLKGKLRYLKSRIILSDLNIHINYERHKPSFKVHTSHWDWINSLGLKRLLNERE